MHSRRDQVQTHRFMVGRLVSALLTAEPDAQETPTKRGSNGLLVGLVLGLLAAGGFTLLGVFLPGGGTSWNKPGTLIVDKSTGTRFVFVDGQLRPVLNYSSARLLLGAKLTVKSVASKSLATVPKGAPVGIVGAPDTLPNPARHPDTFLVCANGGQDDTSATPALSVQIGVGAGTGSPLPDDQAVLVRTANGTKYLAWRDRRMRLDGDWVALALGYADKKVLTVRDAWVNALSAGPDLASLPVPDRGQAGPPLDGTPTIAGQVFAVHSPGMATRYFLLTGGRLVPLTETGVALALGDPATSQSYPGEAAKPRELSPAALASVPTSAAPASLTNLPASPPKLVTGGATSTPCVSVGIGHDTARARVCLSQATPSVDSFPAGLPIVRTPATADSIMLAPGGGMLARTLPAPGIAGAGMYLVTDSGVKFPVASSAAANALGFTVGNTVGVPADLLDLLPTGPVLQRLGQGGDATS